MKFLTILSTTALISLISALPAPSDEPSILSTAEVTLPAYRPITGSPAAGDGVNSVKRGEVIDLEKRATLIVDVWQSEFYYSS
jgi:hypothetical protein